MSRYATLATSALLIAGGFSLTQPEGAANERIASAALLPSERAGGEEPKCTLEYRDGAWVWVCYD